jgi:uncharacterized membrane protein
MTHIIDHGTRFLSIVSGVIVLVLLVISTFWRVTLAIGFLIIFSAACTFLALLGFITGPLAYCAAASWRVVGRRRWSVRTSRLSPDWKSTELLRTDPHVSRR